MLISSTIITDAIFIPYLPICIWYLQLGRYTVYGPRNRILGKIKASCNKNFNFWKELSTKHLNRENFVLQVKNKTFTFQKRVRAKYFQKSLSNIGSYLPWVQCDQMTRLCFQYLALYSNENLPKSIQTVPKWDENFAQNQINLKFIAKYF